MNRDLGVCTRGEALDQIVGEFVGLTIVDIGSGDGALDRQLAKAGADVTGVDPLGPEEDWTSVGTGRYRLLRQGAETLPLQNASVDLVLFMFSLHHIPAAILPGMLTEARRVMRATGLLYIAEPLAEGPGQEISALYHDETAVRRHAAEILAAHAPALFKQHEAVFYHTRLVYSGFEEYAAKMTATMRYNDFTEAQLRAPAVQERFETVADRLGGIFDLPARVDLLRP
jgi:SAM-dependent methyltransferase